MGGVPECWRGGGSGSSTGEGANRDWIMTITPSPHYKPIRLHLLRKKKGKKGKKNKLSYPSIHPTTVYSTTNICLRDKLKTNIMRRHGKTSKEEGVGLGYGWEGAWERMELYLRGGAHRQAGGMI